MSTIFLISSISLFSIYCYRLKEIKEITIISEITWFLFIRRFWKCIFKFFDYISFKYQQIKWGSHQQVKAEAIINYFIRYFESTSVKISAKRNWGCTLKLQFASWYRMLWPLENMYRSPCHPFSCSYSFFNWKKFNTTLNMIYWRKCYSKIVLSQRFRCFL